MIELTNKINELGNSWEEFKYTNNERLKKLEEKSYDPLIEEKLRKINYNIDKCSQKISNIESSDNLSYSSRSLDKEDKEFSNFLKKGISTKDASFTHQSSGEMFIRRQLSSHIVNKINDLSPIRKIASHEVISTEILEVAVEKEFCETKWISGNSALSEKSTNTPTLARVDILSHMLYAQPKATQKFLDDAAIDVNKWLVNSLVDAFNNAEEESFINGNGITQPRGIFRKKVNTKIIKSGIEGGIDFDSIIKLNDSIKSKYFANASYLMNRATLQNIRMLKDKNGQYLWQPGLATRSPDTLFGIPIYTSDHIPAPANKAYTIAIGDFNKAYRIVDRVGISIMRDHFTEKPFVKFYTTKRVGGDIINEEAYSLLELTA